MRRSTDSISFNIEEIGVTCLLSIDFLVKFSCLSSILGGNLSGKLGVAIVPCGNSRGIDGVLLGVVGGHCRFKLRTEHGSIG